MNENEFIDNEEGVEIVELDGEPFEIIGELEHEGELYFALIPYTEEEEDEDEEIGFVILKEAEENGEFFLTTIDDEDEFYDKMGEKFLKLFAGDFEEE